MTDQTPPQSQPRPAWWRRLNDRVPTKHLATASTALFLAVTAAFGGLATAEVPPVPTAELNDPVELQTVTLTVTGAFIATTLPEAGLTAGPGEGIIAVTVSAENTGVVPHHTAGSGGALSSVRLDAAPDALPTAIIRADDTTILPTLQPGVPAELVLAWVLPEETLRGDDGTVGLTIHQLEHAQGAMVTAGDYWVTGAEFTTLRLHPALITGDTGAGDQ